MAVEWVSNSGTVVDEVVLLLTTLSVCGGVGSCVLDLFLVRTGASSLSAQLPLPRSGRVPLPCRDGCLCLYDFWGRVREESLLSGRAPLCCCIRLLHGLSLVLLFPLSGERGNKCADAAHTMQH